MKAIDLLKKNDLRASMQKAIKDNDAEGFSAAFDEMLKAIADDVRQQYEEQFDTLRSQTDTQVLAGRGVRLLTNEEKEFYQKFGAAVKDNHPKQAIEDANLVMPQTVITAVFEDLQSSHPLLSCVNFRFTGATVKMLMNTNDYQCAAWGKLCDEIERELSSGFKEIDTGLFKLTAFLPVCKSMIELGPDWLDRFVREVLYEAYANGLETAILTGDGKEQPIGMNRQVGDGVTVTDGVYPKKTKINISDLSAGTIGNLLSMLAVGPNGKTRLVSNVILAVSPQDYFSKIFPATTIMAPDGTYRNDVLPYPITVIQSPAVENGEAILGMANKYFAAAGSSNKGKIDYSDHVRFLEDERLYLVKGYANGMPMDNNAFLYLDISDLNPITYKVTVVDAPTPSADATLSDLKIGSLSLAPAFAAETADYSAATSNAQNTITATPSEAGAEIEITHSGSSGEVDIIPNGTAAKWENGDNTVTIKVTAADGTTTKTYTVTVTRSDT